MNCGIERIDVDVEPAVTRRAARDFCRDCVSLTSSNSDFDVARECERRAANPRVDDVYDDDAAEQMRMRPTQRSCGDGCATVVLAHQYMNHDVFGAFGVVFGAQS